MPDIIRTPIHSEHLYRQILQAFAPQITTREGFSRLFQQLLDEPPHDGQDLDDLVALSRAASEI